MKGKRLLELTALLVLALLVLAGCGSREKTAVETPLPPAGPIRAEAAATEGPIRTEPGSTPDPEPAPGETAPGETELEETAQPFVRSNGLEADGSFGAGAVFVGDSLTHRFIYYLREQGELGAARCMAICGMPLSKFFDAERAPLTTGLSDGNASVCSPEFEGMSYAEALAALGADARAIYFMLGTNISWESTTDAYLEVLRHILEACPAATVYLQTIPYSTNADYVSVNEAIHASWEILETEAPRRVVLLESGEAFPRYALMSDGIHYSDPACAAWYTYLTDRLSEIAD